MITQNHNPEKYKYDQRTGLRKPGDVWAMIKTKEDKDNGSEIRERKLQKKQDKDNGSEI